MATGDFSGTDRFELLRRLGEGGFGVVYEALDRERHAKVALKWLRAADGANLYRFKREFRALADLAHPNLVALDEFLTDGPHWFFTMELVVGEPLVAYVRHASTAVSPEVASAGWSGAVTMGGSAPPPAEPPAAAVTSDADLARLRGVVVQLADALAAMHGHGIVHRDIKPSNVLVAADGRVVVLDFGLVDDENANEDREILGTPAYMAPEQAAGGRATAASDWYSVGVMIYEALTGRLPFTGHAREMLQAKQHWDPPSPDALTPGAPADLAAVCHGLLQREPQRRLSADEVLRRLGATPSVTAVDGGAPPTLVGRARHLDALTTAFGAMEAGAAVVALVSGRSGMGKTAVVRRFLQDVRSRHPTALVLTGRCYERESVPHKAIDGLIDALSQYLDRLPDIEVARVLPRDAALLARVFPVLLRVAEVGRAPRRPGEDLDPIELRRRGALALRELLYALSERVRVVLAIDDLQWGDLDSAVVLRELLRPHDPPPLLLIAAFRAEDADAAVVRAIREAAQAPGGVRLEALEVGALTLDEARAVALSRLGAAADAAARAEAIARESAGNAFFVHELAHHAAAGGGDVALQAVVRARIAALPEAARRLLQAVALSAEPLPASVAAAAAALDADVERDALRQLRVNRFVRGRGRPGVPELETYHDRIRETVADDLRPGELREWHRHLAVAWENSGLARPDSLVVHYDGAGMPAKAVEYAVVAAAQARSALAFDREAGYYRLLLDRSETAADRRRWLIALGQALVNGGRDFEAANAFLAALDGASAEEAIDLERLAAAHLMRSGHLDDAYRVLAALLPKLGVHWPRRDVTALAALATARARMALRGTRFVERDAAEIPPRVLQRIDVLSSLSGPLSLGDLLRGNTLLVRSTRLALEAGERGRVARALGELACAAAVGGTRNNARIQRLLAGAYRLAERSGNELMLGYATLADGIASKITGRFPYAIEKLDVAVDILQRCPGTRWELETGRTVAFDARFSRGEWTQMTLELPQRRSDAEQRGDLYALGYLAARATPLALLLENRIEDAVRASEAAFPSLARGVQLRHADWFATRCEIDLYDGHADRALDRLDTHRRLLWPLLFAFQMSRIETTFQRGRLWLAVGPRGDRRSLTAVEHAMRRLRRERSDYATALAQLLDAGMASFSQPRDAVASGLERVEAQLRAIGLAQFAAAAAYRRGQIAGGPEGVALAAEALGWFRAQRVANPERAIDALAPGAWATRL